MDLGPIRLIRVPNARPSTGKNSAKEVSSEKIPTSNNWAGAALASPRFNAKQPKLNVAQHPGSREPASRTDPRRQSDDRGAYLAQCVHPG
jgi:hypothetical protein